MIKANPYSNKPIITIVVGTRPEAIKLAPVYLTLKASNKIITRLVLTGQHKDLVTQVLDIFQIDCDKNFNLMREKQSLEFLTKQIIEELSKEFEEYLPSLLLVQGDTTTAFVSALCAFYKRIPIGHVEAGLRTNNIYSPYPEEANRRLISQISTIHFAPTVNAKNNLILNGINSNIHVTGNTVIDALLTSLKFKNKPSKFKKENEKLILVTIHRRENQGLKLKQIAFALIKIVYKFNDVRLLIPLHPNPDIRGELKKYLKDIPRISLVEPLEYVDLISEMNSSYLLLTDSGGLQEEAPTLGKPVLVLRESTEREEVIKSGGAILVGSDSDLIIEKVSELIYDKSKYAQMANTPNPYGDGHSSKKILKIIEEFLEI